MKEKRRRKPPVRRSKTSKRVESHKLTGTIRAKYIIAQCVAIQGADGRPLAILQSQPEGVELQF